VRFFEAKQFVIGDWRMAICYWILQRRLQEKITPFANHQ
jgi:hypothetical protein